MRSPQEYRALTLTAALGARPAATTAPHLAQDARSAAGPLLEYPRKTGLETGRASR